MHTISFFGRDDTTFTNSLIFNTDDEHELPGAAVVANTSFIYFFNFQCNPISFCIKLSFSLGTDQKWIETPHHKKEQKPDKILHIFCASQHKFQ